MYKTTTIKEWHGVIEEQRDKDGVETFTSKCDTRLVRSEYEGHSLLLC